MNYRFGAGLFLVLMLSSVSMDASQRQHKKPTLLEKINTKWQKFKLDWWSTNYGVYGCTSVSPENEVLVRGILQEMDVAKRETIQVKKLSSYAINYKNIGNASIIVMPAKWDFPATIFISQDWFDTFSIEEKRFLIGHEIAHLELEHSKDENEFLIKKYATYGGLGLVAFLFGKVYPRLRWVNRLLFLGGLLGSELMLTPYFWGKLIKRNELQADYYAAKTLNCVEGGISWLKKMKQYYLELQKELPRTVGIECNHHPSFDERIELLEKLKEEMNFDKSILNQILIR